MGEPNSIDANNEKVHRVRTQHLERYKAGVIPVVRAVCGKRWAPTLPFTGNMREQPKCSGCFPPEEYRYSLVV